MRRLAVATTIVAVLSSGCAVTPAVSVSPGAPAGASAPSGAVSAPTGEPSTATIGSAAPTASEPGAIPAPGAYDVPSTGGVKLLPTASGGLDGRTIVLDPGHNGKFVYSVNNKMTPTWGSSRHACQAYGTASLDKKTTESGVAFALATRAATLLRAQGATVVLTRPDDAGTGPCNNERADIANRNAASLLISLHVNGVDGAEAQQRIHGFHVNYSDVMMGGPEMSKRSKILAELFVQAMKKDSAMPTSNYEGKPGDPVAVRSNDLAMLNGVATGPAILTEVGVMQNAGDYAILASPEGQDGIAKAVAEAATAMLADPSMAGYTPKPTTAGTP